MLDRVVAKEHGLVVGSVVTYRGTELRIVGLSRGTSAWMAPLAFATRATLNALDRQPRTASFFLVSPRSGVSPARLVARIERNLPGVSALTREEAAANDRRLFTGAFNGILLAMVTIASAVAIMVIGLTVYTSTSERGREYATLKAIGLGRLPLLRLAATQAGALALAGTVVGAGLAFAGVRAASALAPKYLIVVSASSVLLMAAAALVMALVASFLPAPLPRPARSGDRVPAMSVPVVRRQLLAHRGRTLAGLAGIAFALLLVLALKAILAGAEGRLTGPTAAAPTSSSRKRAYARCT